LLEGKYEECVNQAKTVPQIHASTPILKLFST